MLDMFFCIRCSALLASKAWHCHWHYSKSVQVMLTSNHIIPSEVERKSWKWSRGEQLIKRQSESEKKKQKKWIDVWDVTNLMSSDSNSICFWNCEVVATQQQRHRAKERERYREIDNKSNQLVDKHINMNV